LTGEGSGRFDRRGRFDRKVSGRNGGIGSEDAERDCCNGGRSSDGIGRRAGGANRTGGVNGGRLARGVCSGGKSGELPPDFGRRDEIGVTRLWGALSSDKRLRHWRRNQALPVLRRREDGSKKLGDVGITLRGMKNLGVRL